MQNVTYFCKGGPKSIKQLNSISLKHVVVWWCILFELRNYSKNVVKIFKLKTKHCVVTYSFLVGDRLRLEKDPRSLELHKLVNRSAAVRSL